MRIGSAVFATSQGLGILAKSFFDHGVITDVAVIRHGRHAEHDEWYPGAPRIGSLRHPEELYALCDRCDVMLFFETPFCWDLLPYCRSKGIKTAMMPMYECMPRHLPYQPDLFLCPSLLDQQYYPHGVHIPVPVEVPWRHRTRAEIFLHHAGHGGLKGRNGTAELIEAWGHVRSPARLILRCQEGVALRLEDRRVDHIRGTVPYDQLWTEGDVFVFAEKFNGLSLPLQESRAAGMLVMCGARFPMTEWLPHEPLIPVAGYRKNRIGPPYNSFDEAMFDPRAIAETIDEWYGRNIEDYSLAGKAWAESMSWDALKPRYMETLCA